MIFKDYKDIAEFAKSEGFTVTSTTGGKHNKNSKHYKGLAVDLRTWNKTNAQIEAFIKKARSLGLIVRDERVRPKGQAVWGGAHLHLEIGTPAKPQVLKEGARGAEVKEIQQLLYKRGYLTAKGVDGCFGPNTTKAVKSFQYQRGIRVDGIVGDTTLRELKLEPVAPAV